MRIPILCDRETADLSCSCRKMSPRVSEQSLKSVGKESRER